MEDLIRIPVIRYALKTGSGRAVMKAFGFNQHELMEFVRLEHPEVRSRLSLIADDLAEFRALRAREGRPIEVKAGQVAAEEKYLTEMLARRHLRLLEPGAKIEYVRAETKLGFDNKLRLFKEWTPPKKIGSADAPTLDLPSERAAMAARREAEIAGTDVEMIESAPGAGRRLVSKFSEFREQGRMCKLAQKPQTKKAAMKSRLGYSLLSFLAFQGVTATTYIQGMGEEAFDQEEMASDLLISAVASVTNVSLLRPNLKFGVQWIHATIGIEGMETIDATIYMFSPLHLWRTGEIKHSSEEAGERFAFNSYLTFLSGAWREVTMYELISSLLCLHPESFWTKTGAIALGSAFVLRMADGYAGARFYFTERHRVLGH